MEFNCEGQNGGNNGGIILYNYGLDHRELCGQFLVLIVLTSSNCVQKWDRHTNAIPQAYKLRTLSSM